MEQQTPKTIRDRIKNEFMVIKSLGVVYGDIGTSPIYTFAVIMLLTKPTMENIFGLLSLLVWTLFVLVTVQYAWLATSLSNRGEGGTVVLTQILKSYLRNTRHAAIVSALGFVGISLMIGDGVITPAISILSAVEGIVLIPGYEHTSKYTLLALASVIAFILFYVQKKGIEKVATAFGPIMVAWFLVLGCSGIYFIAHMPSVLAAVNPLYAVTFILHNPLAAFIILADVILCATGGEALYADMGHLGRSPILKGWLFVFVTLSVSYFGQGAFLMTHAAEAGSPLFEMIKEITPALYAAFVVLAILATIIASQAMISGIFSVLYQAMTTKIFPHFKVEYTSYELSSQIYVNSVNWFLFACVILMLFVFGESAKLASAYGLAVTGAMSITALLMCMIYFKQKNYFKLSFAFICLVASATFFASCILKIPHGGYWSIIIASVPLAIVIIYTQGQKRLYASFIPTPKEEFLSEYRHRYPRQAKIEGTALFFSRHLTQVPAYIPKTMFQNGIMYERNIIVKVKVSDEPRGIKSELVNIEEGLELLTIWQGYMEILNMESILQKNEIYERTIFYGQEEIVTKHPIWMIFAMIKSLSPTFVSFYNFPHKKLIGVVRRAEF